jgi:CBS domain-containing protein
MLCSDLIKTNVLIADANGPASEAAIIMRESNVGFLPVCDLTTGEILGTITDRDIVVRMVAEEMPSSTTVGELATPATVFCRVNMDIENAHQLMRHNHVARLLCVDENGRLAGVLSLSDLAASMPDLATETLRELGRRDRDDSME